MREYYVSGTIQFTIKARTAVEAAQKAERRVQRFMHSPSVNIGLDNIEASGLPSVDLADAAQLDAIGLELVPVG